ncbi:hypothetical protein E2C01_005655 [Portunus trituberculatus]|uniref:Uncharacterized protein n=1 Tax=Portunus trituberculatus TaxID=210409 RepID=A0A5B7CU31_PORTR|nr:hypothetical protein [Portunus trituberculatus]
MEFSQKVGENGGRSGRCVPVCSIWPSRGSGGLGLNVAVPLRAIGSCSTRPTDGSTRPPQPPPHLAHHATTPDTPRTR